MPDSEYMNDKQIEFFRAKLQKQKDDLLSNAGETTEHLREDTSIVPDPADRATIEEEHALELRTRDRERKLLKKIAQSLARLDSGEYGYCDETGEPIGLARLLARRRPRCRWRPSSGANSSRRCSGTAAVCQSRPADLRLRARNWHRGVPSQRHGRKRELLPQGGSLCREPGHRLDDLTRARKTRASWSSRSPSSRP
jgi:RNA polymerase-binding protein DksA